MAEDTAPSEGREGGNPAGRRPWVRLLKHIVGLIIVAGFAGYLWLHRKDLAVALDVTLGHFFALCILIVVSWLLNGIQAHVIYRAVNLPVSVWEGTMLTMAGAFGNYLPMRAGTVIRALYLKNVHGLRLARFGGITALRVLLTVIAAGVMGTIGLIAIWLMGLAPAPLNLIGIFVSLILFPLLFMAFPAMDHSWLPARARKIAQESARAYNELRQKPVVAFQVVLLLLAQYMVLAVRFIISADAIDADMAPGFIFLMAPLAALMSFAALTPGGLGLREGIMGFVTLSVGYSFSEGVFVGAVDRAVLLVMVALFGGFAFLKLWRRLN